MERQMHTDKRRLDCDTAILAVRPGTGVDDFYLADWNSITPARWARAGCPCHYGAASTASPIRVYLRVSAVHHPGRTPRQPALWRSENALVSRPSPFAHRR